MMTTSIPVEDRKELQEAKNILENPGLAARLTNLIGAPIEKGLGLLPPKVNKEIEKITKTALLKASDAALFTMKDIPGESSSNNWHKLGVAVSGGVGGFFGVAAIAIELPISTTIMMRSIIDVARGEGESISTPEAKFACLEVFALGGKSTADDGTESGYYVIRAALATEVEAAIKFLLTNNTADKGAPVIVKLMAIVAEYFSVVVTEKFAAQAVPAIGAAGGAMINTLFIDHFQDMARGHFMVRRLERKHGKEVIERLYKEMPKFG